MCEEVVALVVLETLLSCHLAFDSLGTSSSIHFVQV